MNFLNYYLWDGGHTQFAAVTGLVEGIREKSQELVPTLGLTFENAINYMADLTLKTSTSEAAHAARAEMVRVLIMLKKFRAQNRTQAISIAKRAMLLSLHSIHSQPTEMHGMSIITETVNCLLKLFQASTRAF